MHPGMVLISNMLAETTQATVTVILVKAKTQTSLRKKHYGAI